MDNHVPWIELMVLGTGRASTSSNRHRLAERRPRNLLWNYVERAADTVVTAVATCPQLTEDATDARSR